MKNLLDAKLCKFKEDFNIQNSTEEKSWERFVNYEFFPSFSLGDLIRIRICWIRYVLIHSSFLQYRVPYF